MKKYLIVLSLVFLAVGCIKTETKTSENFDTTQSPRDPDQTPNDIGQTSPIKSKIFSSSRLKISFTYPTEEGWNDQTMKYSVKENGSKVYVYFSDYDTNPDLTYKSGQYVEVFSKDASLTLEQEVSNKFLSSFPNCEVNITVSRTITKISIRPKIIDSNQDFYDHVDWCPKDRAAVGGVAYFWFDSKFPDRYAFFSIGQYGIPIGGSSKWEDTFTFTK